MAAASTVPYGRQKKSVYGKASKSSWNATNFFDDSDDELTASAPAPIAKVGAAPRSASVKTSYTVQKTEVKRSASPKVTKTKKVSVDTFDVPSSGDEEPSSPPKPAQRPVSWPTKRLVEDGSGEAKLAPWEREKVRKAANEANFAARRSKLSVTSPDNQLRADLGAAAKPLTQTQSSAAPSPGTGAVTGNFSSAAARLAARRKIAEPNLSSADDAGRSKRPAVKATLDGTSRKRARTAEPARGSSVDIAMADHDMLPVCYDSGNAPTSGDEEAGVYDFPSSSADESSKSQPRSRSPKVTKPVGRRNKLPTSSARATPQKGLSAPARLAEMLPSDSDMTEPSTASPAGSASRGATPHLPSTPPPSHKRSSPNTVIKRGNMTPKQAQLWNKLLPPDISAPSPSALAMKELTISGSKPPSVERALGSRRLTKTQPDVGRRRTRLVDRLKASAESSSEDESAASSDDSDDLEDVEARDTAPIKPPLQRAESTQSRAHSGSASQSQSRSRSQIATGLRRTYASQRSHLAEDNLEDDIMAGLIEDSPRPAIGRFNASGSLQTRSKKDAFDLDDSDDEMMGTGAIRTIHELRAAGRHIRGTEDIEQLLEDVENHSTAHKSRRRSALIGLATKLTDKTFASRFIGQGCDLRLARQCGVSQDDIANFILAASLALLLVSDPPEHTLRTLRDNSIASWLGTLLSSTQSVSMMAKERKLNMAKASQTDLVQLTELVRTHQSLWGEGSPVMVSIRIVVLRCLDLLVSKSRRGGDKSKLIAAEHLPMVLIQNQSTSDGELETSLAISVLESLSTASLTLAWDPRLLERIAQTLTSSNTATPQRRHTLFLTLRLCLNLTTDNARNCGLLANNVSVPYLLRILSDGFVALDTETEEETRTLALDILVLALGILINLFEHSSEARKHATANGPDLLTSLVSIFMTGQKRMADAESLEESTSNVALGYLAVVLANLCQDAGAREVVRDALPGRRLALVGDAVEEFVLFHQQVDRMASFEGEEGQAVWGGFTEKLRGVLERVRMVEGEMEGEVMQN